MRLGDALKCLTRPFLKICLVHLIDFELNLLVTQVLCPSDNFCLKALLAEYEFGRVGKWEEWELGRRILERAGPHSLFSADCFSKVSFV